MVNYACRSLILIFLCQYAINSFAQVGPACQSINKSLDAFDSVTVGVKEFVRNVGTELPLTFAVTSPSGAVIAQTIATNTDDFVRFEACQFVGRKLIVSAMNSAGMCSKELEVKPGGESLIMGRSVEVYCTDSLLLGGEIDGSPPVVKTSCADYTSASKVADWIQTFPCEVGQDTVKVIYREYEAFDKFGLRSTGFDTIFVRRFPQISSANTFCAAKDSTYCGDPLSSFGPFMLLPSLEGQGCDTVYFLNPDGTARSFDPKCGVNVLVSEMPFPADCGLVIRYDIQLKQSCYGGSSTGCPNQDLPINVVEQLSPGYLACTFWRMTLDTTPPIIKCDQDTIVISAGTHGCEAHVSLPPINAVDSCGSVKQVKARIEGHGTYAFSNSGGSFTSAQSVTIPYTQEPIRIIYEAYDNCHNIGLDTCYLQIKDRTVPIAVSVKGLNVSVGSKNAWLDVDQIDEESWDNCDIALRLVRRSDWETAGIDLCDSLMILDDLGNGDTLWQSVLSDQLISDPIEHQYQEAIEWLLYDDEPCGDLVASAWEYDLARYATLECKGVFPEYEFDLIMKDRFDPNLHFDYIKQIGGGWSRGVPLLCSDVCSNVKVELLVMDYWCNWGKTWSEVWVEDKSPLEIVKELEPEITITCKTLKERHTLGEFGSLFETVQQADQDDDQAIALLNDIFGTFSLAWQNSEGELVDDAGAALDCEIPFVDSVCICEDSVVNVLVYDHDAGWIYEEQIKRHCTYEPRLDTIDNGAILVNCAENVQMSQDLTMTLDHCGLGIIERSWKLWKLCTQAAGHAGSETPDTVFYTQRIRVEEGCDLDPGMFTVPSDTAVSTCVLEYDPSGSGNVAGSAHPDSIGRPEFLFDDDCRLVGIGYVDKVLQEVTSDSFCYKILRTWCFADWCNVQNDIPDNWWSDPNYEGILFKHVQKILVKCECSCELDCSLLRDTTISCLDIPSDVEDLFPLFSKPQIVHPDTNFICEFTLDSLIRIDTNICGFGTVSRTWYLMDEMDVIIDSCSESIALLSDSIQVIRQSSYGGDAEPFNCSDSLVLDPVNITAACPRISGFSVSNDSPFAENDSNDASGNYPVGIHLVNYKISSDCLDTIFLTDTITVLDDVSPSVIVFSDPCVSLSEWETDFNNDPLNPDIRMMLALNAIDNCEVDTIFLVGLDSMFFPDDLIRDSILYTYLWQAIDTSGNMSVVEEASILVSDSCQVTLQSPMVQSQNTTKGYRRQSRGMLDSRIQGSLKLAKEDRLGLASFDGSDWAGFQNYPNPFRQETVIRFSMINDGIVSFRVLNSRGQLIMKTTSKYPQGLSEIWVGRKELGGAGIYFYQIETEDFIMTKKMILLE